MTDQALVDEDDLTPPSQDDETAAGGSTPDVESDDDVDRLGEEVGIHYEPDEELDIVEKTAEREESPPAS